MRASYIILSKVNRVIKTRITLLVKIFIHFTFEIQIQTLGLIQYLPLWDLSLISLEMRWEESSEYSSTSTSFIKPKAVRD